MSAMNKKRENATLATSSTHLFKNDEQIQKARIIIQRLQDYYTQLNSFTDEHTDDLDVLETTQPMLIDLLDIKRNLSDALTKLDNAQTEKKSALITRIKSDMGYATLLIHSTKKILTDFADRKPRGNQSNS